MDTLWDQFLSLLDRSFKLIVHKNWLKQIDKSLDKYNKAERSLRQAKYVVYTMLHEYNKEYGKTYDEERWKL